MFVSCFHKSSLGYIPGMNPLEQHYAGGRDAAFSTFGLTKLSILSGGAKAQLLQDARSRPKGLAAIQALAPQPSASGLELDRSHSPIGYGTPGRMAGASLQPRTGKVVGLPNKLAEVTPGSQG
jgi:hypothetical protein